MKKVIDLIGDDHPASKVGPPVSTISGHGSNIDSGDISAARNILNHVIVHIYCLMYTHTDRQYFDYMVRDI